MNLEQRLGIDHPLITGHSIEELRNSFTRLGFVSTPVGFHPWGTATSLCVFPENFLELMSIADPAKVSWRSPDGFGFGAFIADFLKRGTGVSLVALRSFDVPADYAATTARGVPGKGLIDFRRAVTLPGGSRDEAVVSLGILVDDTLPSASNFLCHQHRPEFVWVPAWMDHPNTCQGIDWILYRSTEPEVLVDRFTRLYGEQAVVPDDNGWVVRTGLGSFIIWPDVAVARRYPLEERPINAAANAAVTIGLRCKSLAQARFILDKWNSPYTFTNGHLRIPAQNAGNVILEIYQTEAPLPTPTQC